MQVAFEQGSEPERLASVQCQDSVRTSVWGHPWLLWEPLFPTSSPCRPISQLRSKQRRQPQRGFLQSQGVTARLSKCSKNSR